MSNVNKGGSLNVSANIYKYFIFIFCDMGDRGDVLLFEVQF